VRACSTRAGIIAGVTIRPGLDDVRSVQYFRGLSDADAERFAGELTVRSYQPRELILVEGDPAVGFYFLRSGKARIFRTGADGREQSFRLVGKGDTFGEVPVFDSAPNPASVETLETSEVILFPSNVVTDLVRQHPEVALPLLVHFAKRLRSFTELVEQISLQTVPSRIARYLYHLAREEGVPTAGGIVVPREVTQQDLASLVGSVREVVSRALKVMEDDGIVTIRRKEILIRDLAALREMS
jgi:CRP-like cAMP-binding protein